MRNTLAYVLIGQHTMGAAALRQAFPQLDQAAARQTWRHVADQFRTRWLKLVQFLDGSEHNMLT